MIGPGALVRTRTGFQTNEAFSYGYDIGLTATLRGGTAFIGNVRLCVRDVLPSQDRQRPLVLRNVTGNVFQDDELCFDALELVVIKAEPEVEALIEEGRSAFDAGQWDKAVSAYTPLSHRSLKERRDSYQLGFALFAQGSDLQQAIRWFRTAYQLGHSLPESAYFTASCYPLREDPDQSLT
ncbi:MAG: hypothetical protein DHS20C14_01890 [Phycisphaeraceae bacterium]|nr:MAG: hypothetical protein DHS20C14_01890 [Phycisphaeraceae bacterium]